MVSQYALAPVWNKAESLFIAATTTDTQVWADKTAGGASASTNAALSGTDKFWTVQALQVNLDVDGIVTVTINSMDTDKTTALETIPFQFYSKGTYVVPVMWKAATANKHLKIGLDGDGTVNVYVRAIGVKPLAV